MLEFLANQTSAAITVACLAAALNVLITLPGKIQEEFYAFTNRRRNRRRDYK